MKECVCAGCTETPGQFKDYVQCSGCNQYGHIKDSFIEDPNKEFCDYCYREYKAIDPDERR